VFAAMAAARAIAALWMLEQGLRGRDDARSRRIKAAILEE